MKLAYHKNSGEQNLTVEGGLYNHIFKSRRSKKQDTLFFSNLTEENIYSYKIDNIGKKSAILTLQGDEKNQNKIKKDLHIGWCVVDVKTIEKTLPLLNEIGVGKITFVYCQRSQKNFKINKLKIEKILINSCCQCGRTSLMKIDIASDLKTFISENEDLTVIDFCQDKLNNDENIKTILVGCEGGFSDEEKELLKDKKTLGLNSPFTLKSETAVLVSASKIL